MLTKIKNFSHSLTLIAILLGGFITIGLTTLAGQSLLINKRADFIEQTDVIRDKLSQRLSAMNEMLYGLAAFYDSSKFVDPDEFRTFTRGPLRRNPFLYSVLSLINNKSIGYIIRNVTG